MDATAGVSSTSKANREATLRNFLSCLSNAWAIGSGELLPDSATNLSCFLSTPATPSAQCTFPSLCLTNKSLPASLCNVPVETAASLKLAIPLKFDSDSVVNAPRILLRNVSTSFMTLIDSRLKSSVIALTQAGMSTLTGSQMNDSYKFLTLQSLLKSSANPVLITAVVTSFSMLSMPEDADVPDNNSLVSPLVFEAVVDLSILGSKITVPLRAPGAITGAYPSGQDCSLLENVELAFDTNVFLQAMMKQARFVVRKALATASSLTKAVSSVQSSCHDGQVKNVSDKKRLVSIGSSLGSVGQSLGSIEQSLGSMGQNLGSMGQRIGSLSRISQQNLLRQQVVWSDDERKNANFSLNMASTKEKRASLFQDVLNGRCMPPPPPRTSTNSLSDLLKKASNMPTGSRTAETDERFQAQHQLLLHKTNERNKIGQASSPRQIQASNSSQASFEQQLENISEADVVTKRRKINSNTDSSSSDMADFRAAMVLATSALKHKSSQTNLQEVRSHNDI